MKNINKADIPVVILCGGQGTRLREETEFRPKPLVEIGGKPILWHIMKIYSAYGFNNFILSLGYKGDMIKDYFLNFRVMNSDITVNLSKPESIQFYDHKNSEDWTVTMVNTGDSAQTGARIKGVQRYIKSDIFMATYGDGVADINVDKLVKYHLSHGKIGTVTGVHPASRFGEIVDRKGIVEKFHEKPQTSAGQVSSGFFVFNYKFFDYLRSGDDCVLESDPLVNLVKDKQLNVYSHTGFWQCVDTYRELLLLNKLWKSHRVPWKVW